MGTYLTSWISKPGSSASLGYHQSRHRGTGKTELVIKDVHAAAGGHASNPLNMKKRRAEARRNTVIE